MCDAIKLRITAKLIRVAFNFTVLQNKSTLHFTPINKIAHFAHQRHLSASDMQTRHHTDGNERKQRCLWLFENPQSQNEHFRAGMQCKWESFQEKQCFAYYTGTEISEGLHSRLSTGGTELRLKEPED